MATSDPTAVVHAWFERVWNQGDLTAIDDMLAVDAVAHGLGDGSVKGPEEFRAFATSFREAIPDFHVEILRTVTEGLMCASHIVVTGTHAGAGLGIPATGRKIRFEAMTMVRVENGQIREGWNTVDFLALYQQLGVVPKLPGQC